MSPSSTKAIVRTCLSTTERRQSPNEPLWAVQLATTPSERAAAIDAIKHEFQIPLDFRVVALLAGFNEVDVLGSSLRHYLCQGVSVHFIDNWSTDGTADTVATLQDALDVGALRCGLSNDASLLSRLSLTYELFPAKAPTGTYDWSLILRRKAELSNRGGVRSVYDADWVIHADPDELRESPWGPEISLRQALYVAHRMGYNKASFDKLVVFRPVRTVEPFPAEGGDLRSAFEFFDRSGIEVDRSTQIKAWRRRFRARTLAPGQSWMGSESSVVPAIKFLKGGHVVQHLTSMLENRVFPWSFVLRHYPIRSQGHGERKVFRERQARWNRSERKNGWHTQYDAIKDESHVFVLDPIALESAPRGELPLRVYARCLVSTCA